MKNPVSLALVGGGMANTFVLLRVASALSSAFRQRKLADHFQGIAIKIYLINADRHFGGGVAYGKSHPSLLFNTPVSLIQPQEEFQEWLEDNIDWVLDRFKSRAGEVGERWLKKYSNFLFAGNHAEIALPRMVYGLFLQHQLWKAYCLLKQTNERYGTDIKIEFLEAQVETVLKYGDSFEIRVKDNLVKQLNLVEQEDGSLDFVTQAVQVLSQGLFADVISLGVGFANKEHPHLAQVPTYFSSVYSPGIETITQTILCHPASKVKVALLGTKAAALDVIYYADSHAQLRKRSEIYAISISGETREPAVLSDRHLPYFPTKAFIAINTSDELVNAVQQEIQKGQLEGYTKLEVWRSLIKTNWMKIRRENLPLSEKYKFDRQGQVDLRKITSFTDCDAIEAFDRLKRDQILYIVQGKILDINACLNDSHKFCLSIDRTSYIDHLEVDMVINCMGPEMLSLNHSPLIKSILAERLAEINESGVGFQVNCDREASPGFFVVGPLTSGGEIVNKKGQSEFHLVRHTIPYVLEDARLAGKAIANQLLQQSQETPYAKK